jgi:hypothetical protein
VPLRPDQTPRTFAEALWQIADERQVFIVPPILPGGTFHPCAQILSGEARVLASIPKNIACGGMPAFIEDQATDMAAQAALADVIGMPPQLVTPPALTAQDIAQIKSTVLATEFEPRLGAQVYKHFRCVDRGAGPLGSGPKCEYVLPAKRLNVFPNGVDLVFIDDRREFTNPAFPIWLILWKRHVPPSNPNDETGPLFQLCNAPRGQGFPFSARARSFRDLQRDCRKFTVANGVVTAVPCQ